MIRFSVITIVRNDAPGVIRTDFARALWEDPEKEKALSRTAPLRRIGEPDDIAGAVVFLASPAGALSSSGPSKKSNASPSASGAA